ncbi:MAG: hypothetical protein HYR64_05685 [Fimbriimonas ginsengisoli]|uniref:Uncharacterized protein n=1 Tax=Fimbriimonas ginsengisoli TaxID=1005039 RepID=A0A931M0C5_FIMGI|nr:hypothetical protein [Fimbriimonas ginsengisoli]
MPPDARFGVLVGDSSLEVRDLASGKAVGEPMKASWSDPAGCTATSSPDARLVITSAEIDYPLRPLRDTKARRFFPVEPQPGQDVVEQDEGYQPPTQLGTTMWARNGWKPLCTCRLYSDGGWTAIARNHFDGNSIGLRKHLSWMLNGRRYPASAFAKGHRRSGLIAQVVRPYLAATGGGAKRHP